MSGAPRPGSRIVPALRYRNASAAIDWLCRVLGFERHLIVPGEADGSIAHAQLVLEDRMVMLGSMNEGELSELMRMPDEAGGVTQSAYLVVPDVEQHYRRAKAEGAEMVIELRDEDYGGQHYTARDPEGHLWSFGPYDPWEPTYWRPVSRRSTTSGSTGVSASGP